MASNKITHTDLNKAKNAWITLRSILKSDRSKAQMLEALVSALSDDDVVDGALDVYVKLRGMFDRQEENTQRVEEDLARPAAAGAGWDSDSESEDEDEPEEEEERLRFECNDRTFDHVMNLACYRAALDAEERRDAGGIARPAQLPYGVENSNSVRLKIENYRMGITGRGNFGGGRGRRYATKTIQFLCEFKPTRQQLDEAVDYYRRNAE